jgi:hypothetical protein
MGHAQTRDTDPLDLPAAAALGNVCRLATTVSMASGSRIVAAIIATWRRLLAMAAVAVEGRTELAADMDMDLQAHVTALVIMGAGALLQTQQRGSGHLANALVRSSTELPKILTALHAAISQYQSSLDSASPAALPTPTVTTSASTPCRPSVHADGSGDDASAAWMEIAAMRLVRWATSTGNSVIADLRVAVETLRTAQRVMQEAVLEFVATQSASLGDGLYGAIPSFLSASVPLVGLVPSGACFAPRTLGASRAMRRWVTQVLWSHLYQSSLPETFGTPSSVKLFTFS